MIDSPHFQRVASELGLDVVSRLAGGEFGALLVRDGGGRELVLKVLPLPQLGARFAQGARLAERLRSRGYPAPRYAGTGATAEVVWSLQERLPGSLPDVMREAHARTLVDLAGSHAGAADDTHDWGAFALTRMRRWAEGLRRDDRLGEVARELGRVAERGAPRHLERDSVVHSDFHHRNYLARGDTVSGVFDWELAMIGDWRVDLVTLAFIAQLVPETVPAESRRVIVDAAFGACSPGELAFFGAYQALRQLDYDAREHPERVERLAATIETAIAPWWRDTT